MNVKLEKILDARTDASRPVLFYAQPMNVHQFARNDMAKANDPDWHARARERFRSAPEIELLQGDSGTLLRRVLTTLAEPALFWRSCSNRASSAFAAARSASAPRRSDTATATCASASWR